MKKTIVIVFLLISLSGSGDYLYSKDVVDHIILNHYLEPISELGTDGLSSFKLTFSPGAPCGDNAAINVICRNYEQILSNVECDLELQGIWNSLPQYITYFEVPVPDNDTIQLIVSLQCDTFAYTFEHFYETTGDTVGYRRVDPRVLNSQKSNSAPKTNDPNWDTLTAEQLQTEYEVWVDLRDPKHLEIGEKILGDIPDSCKIIGEKGYYIFKITLERIFQLGEQGIELDEIKKRKTNHTPVSIDKSQPETDSIKGQSKVPASYDGISLEYVDGEITSGIISTNQNITFNIRINNNSSIYMAGVTNGFRIYSPDGAQWGSIFADTLPIGWGDMFNSYYSINYYSNNGIGADTVGYTGIGYGLPPYFDQLSYSITIEQIDDIYDGKTICIDSSFYGGSGYWSWADDFGNSYYPAWDGPHCFTIASNDELSFFGYLNYIDPVPPNTTEEPMRNVRIEMWDDDIAFDDLLASTTTIENGYFALGPITNDDGPFSGTYDVFFRIYAENEATAVSGSQGAEVYTIQTPTFDDLPSGVYDTTIVADNSQSCYFFVADVVLDGYRNWLDLPYTSDPGNVQVVVEAVASGSKYYQQYEYIRIENAISSGMGWPDAYDKDVIFHEYGHRIEHVFTFFDHGGGDHDWISMIDVMLGSSEGFAHFLCNVFNNDPIRRNLYNNFNDTGWTNTENGQYGVNSSTISSVNNWGHLNEGASAGMLWDIYDSNNDDYSSFGQTPFPNILNPDGIGDTLDNGIANILDVLLNRTVNGHYPDNIDEFWEAWFQPEISLGHGNAMEDIWYEHGEIMSCCILRGDVAIPKDGSQLVNDIVHIIDYLFRGGLPSQCEDEADVNNDGAVNVADVVYFVGFLFRGWTPLVPCQ